MIKTVTINLQTNAREQMIDITERVNNIIKENEVEKGLLHLFTPHTTAGITINENADFDVQRDLLLGLRIAFPNRKEFNHFENNSDAHLKSTVVGCAQTIIIEKGSLRLGRWQGVYFCEFDGPRNRQVFIQIIGK